MDGGYAETMMTDEQVFARHPRQAAVLIQVPAQDRQAVLRAAHFYLNTIPGTILSGGLYQARQRYLALGGADGGAEALDAEISADNASLMGWA